jgi:hypothetical protein
MPNKYNWRLDIEEVKSLYEQGFSCSEVGKIVGASRQAVWEKLKNAKVETRAKNELPYVTYNGYKFTISSSTGYYRCTIPKMGRIHLHRYKYICEVGPVEKWQDIHHIDGDKTNNEIGNLECLARSEHTKKYSPHHNQFKNNKTKHLYAK